MPHLVLPVDVALIIPVYSFILHYHIVEHDSATATAIHQTPLFNLTVLSIPCYLSTALTQQTTT